MFDHLNNLKAFKDVSFLEIGLVNLIVVFQSSNELTFVFDNTIIDTVWIYVIKQK